MDDVQMKYNEHLSIIKIVLSYGYTGILIISYRIMTLGKMKVSYLNK